ncbi:MAG: hypothetical protein PHH08_00125 [Candidatus ainarchaeum sp.]|nr:hypothetical protein [Candidatus ainarchaeum sp.]
MNALRKRTPRSLRKPKGESQKYRVRRRKALAKQIVEDKAMAMARKRNIGYANKLFFLIQGKTLNDLIREKIRARGKCSFFEIGSGLGNALLPLLLRRNWRKLGGKVSAQGIDILHPQEDALAKKAIRIGNALSRPFPKSDIIFSVWSLGYIGQTGFMLRKIGSALNPGGLAVLHINQKSYNAQELIKDPNKLESNLKKIRLNGCSTRVFLATEAFPYGALDLEPDDIIVVIKREEQK